MQNACEILKLLTVISIGILFGALLTEGCLLVPYWRSLSADRFYALYKDLYLRLYRFFTPVTIAPLLTNLATIISCIILSDRHKWLAIVSGAFYFGAAASHEFYFKNANTQFANATLAPDELATELKRWSAWHWMRTGLMALAFLTSLIVLKG